MPTWGFDSFGNVIQVDDSADTSFDFGANVTPTTDEAHCINCGKELSETLDAYYGRDWYLKRMCDPCRRKV